MRFKISKAWRKQAGDTLIEVTFALSILSMVLTSSTVVATKSFRLGQTAKERSTIAMAAQGQMEAIRAFRDNNSWDHFLNGAVLGTLPPPGPGSVAADAITPHKGLLTAASSMGCVVTSPCQHMEELGGATFWPEGGSMLGPVNRSYIEVVASPPTSASPNSIDVRINYGFEGLGGGQVLGHIKTTFTNLAYKAPVPAAPAPPPCGIGANDIILVMDTSLSMNESWSGGLTRREQLIIVAHDFIKRLKLSPAGNHVALIGFDITATTYSGFTSNPAVADAAIDAMKNHLGTQYAQGLKEAGKVNSTARPGIKNIIVFMSDGEDNDNKFGQYGDLSEAEIIFGAMKKLMNIDDVYTVGINPNNDDLALLRNMPRGAGYYTDAKSPTALQQAYSGIAGMISCQ